MYRHSQQGPHPIIDTGSGTVKRNTGSAASNLGSAANWCLDTANLGSGPEVFVSGQYYTLISLTAGTQVSFGALLAPLTNYGNGESIYLDYFITASWVDEAVHAVPQIFTLDPAKTPINGWDAANNTSTDEYMIPITASHSNIMSAQGHILIKDIFGSLDPEEYIGLGFSMRTNGYGDNGSIDDLCYTISGRYGFKSFPTFDQER